MGHWHHSAILIGSPVPAPPPPFFPPPPPIFAPILCFFYSNVCCWGLCPFLLRNWSNHPVYSLINSASVISKFDSFQCICDGQLGKMNRDSFIYWDYEKYFEKSCGFISKFPTKIFKFIGQFASKSLQVLTKISSQNPAPIVLIS